MGAVLSALLVIGAMQRCASGYDDEDNILTFSYKCTLKSICGFYYMHEENDYRIFYIPDILIPLQFVIRNDALKNYVLDNIIVNGTDVTDFVKESYYDAEYNFVIGVDKEINPNKKITIKLRFVKTNI